MFICCYTLVEVFEGTISKGLLYPVQPPLQMNDFSNTDWAACLMSRSSLTGYYIFLGHSLVSRKTKKQLHAMLHAACWHAANACMLHAACCMLLAHAACCNAACLHADATSTIAACCMLQCGMLHKLSSMLHCVHAREQL
ncbi:hypothetical protein Tco_1086208 [Tanacetum coccineum]